MGNKYFFGRFETIAQAAECGYSHLTNLKYNFDFNCLTIDDYLNQTYRLDDFQILVKKLRPESEQKTMVTEQDYVETKIKMSDFPTTPGLDGTFSSLAYGIVDHFGQIVPLTGLR
ncbi:MAG: hypothetical protein HC930_04340 [Hydrococcus sp. SU_1_0]|nr:hypothetical protein [Hydrococcus sp. SU_1_0]